MSSKDFKIKNNLDVQGGSINLSDKTISADEDGIKVPSIKIGTGGNEISLSASASGKLIQTARVGGVTQSPVSYTIEGLDNTTITTPADGQVLSYDTTNTKWVNTTPIDAYTKGEVDTAIGNVSVDLSAYDTSVQVTAKVAGIVDSAPETLNTLNELAAALGDDDDYAATITTSLGAKADKTTTYTKTEVDTSLNLKSNLATTYTKTEVDTSLNLKSNLATTYTKTEIDAAIGNISGGASVIVSDTPPTNPSAGDLWTNSTNMALSVYYVDSTSSQWVELNGDLDLGGYDTSTQVDAKIASIQSGSSVVVSDTPPSSPNAGDMWTDSETMKLNVYYEDDDSSQWVEVSGSSTSSSSASGSGVTMETTDPLITNNGTLGELWLNTTSGELYACTDITTDANIWINIGDGTGNITPNDPPGNPTNTTVASQSHESSFNHTFTGGIDTDGNVTHYMVDEITGTAAGNVVANPMTVVLPEVPVGVPHQFTIATLTEDTTISFRVRSKDNNGSYSSGVTVTFLSIAISPAVATGGTVTTAGGYTYHSYTSSGNFLLVVTTAGAIEYLIVAGGGSGGYNYGAGGGAGGVITGSLIASAGNHGVTVGAGGAFNNDYWGVQSSNGGDSTILGLTAYGGGAGGSNSPNGIYFSGLSGGSGGGQKYSGYAGGSSAGSGTEGQGNDGGVGIADYPGGGGGKGSAGGAGTSSGPGDGGSGIDYWGISVGGGGAGGAVASGSASHGGGVSGSAGATNTGGGGGKGASGGSGIVIVRYLT